MKKRFLALLLSLLLLSVSCQKNETAPTPNRIIGLVGENTSLLTDCVTEMESFLLERCYVAMEVPKAEEGETVTVEEKRLVRYEKESGDREELENETLKRALEELGLALIFYQTASDARRCVIFSYSKESDKGVQRGFYYSYDSLPCAWWGRKGALERKDNRYVQANKDGSAWYYTVEISDGFFYFEKSGSLTA